MEFSAIQIAELLQGKVEGDKEATVKTLAKIEEGHEGALSFLANPKYSKYLYETDSTIVIVNNDLELEKSVKETCTLIRVENAYESFAKLLDIYNQYKNNKVGVSSNAIIDSSSNYGENCYIADGVIINENVEIGNNVKIYPNVVIRENVKIGDNSIVNSGTQIYPETIIGKNCTIHSGVVLGADGFGFAPNSDNNYNKVPQIGNVVIEDHVEIGSNTTIDRATLGSTIIKKGVKLDNLIQVAHNVVIGENTVIASQTGIAGSTKIGKNCMIGGQVGIVGHIEIADKTMIAAQSGVGQSIKKEGTIVQGSPSFEIGLYKRSYVGFRNLPKLNDQVSELQKEIKLLKEELLNGKTTNA